MYCSNCGHQLPEKAVICLQCGCAVDNNYAASGSRQPHYNDREQPCSDNNCNCAPKSPKQGVMVLILMLLFGFLGIYRMYVGKVASGIGMALLFLLAYIPLTIWRIMAGFMVSDSFAGAHYDVFDFIFWPWLGWVWIAFLPIFIWWLMDLISLLKGEFTDSSGLKIKI